MLRRPGRPLDQETREWAEPRFGFDFGAVRVHDDRDALRSADQLDASAYTVGRHIVFGSQRSPGRPDAGCALLAHELAHVVQQRDAPRTPSDPIELEAPGSAQEGEADTAARRVARGGRAGGVSRLTAPATSVARLQRTEKGTYVSTVGSAAYLDAGAAYYRYWGHPNVQRVGSMEEVVSDLDRGRDHIDSFRLVAHGSRGAFQFGFLRGVPSSSFTAHEAGFRSAQQFRTATAETRIINDELFRDEVADLLADTNTGPLLQSLGVTSVPDMDSPVGLFLRALLEAHFVSEVRLTDGSVPAIPNRGVMDRFTALRRDRYRSLILEEAPAAQRPTVRRALTALQAGVPAALQGKRTFRFPQVVIDDLADPLLDPNQPNRPQLNPEIARIAEEGAGGPYVTRLARVRSRIDEDTHIEIRGCSVGGDPSFLDALRDHFGDSGALPSISAPDLFQYFFQIADVQTYAFDQARDEDRFAAEFPDIEETYTRMERVRRREAWPVTNESSLTEFAARYGFDLDRLRDLNPEYARREPRMGELVWLVARPPIPAGSISSLQDFCEQVLGDGYLWPRIWGYNPDLQASTLTPQDSVWVVPPDRRSQVAGTEPRQQDLRAELQGGGAFVGFVGGRTLVRLDDRQRAAAFAGWLATQGFDPRGRGASALRRRYQAGFGRAVRGTHIQFLSPDYPEFAVTDILFPSDPRYPAHIIRRP